MSSSNATDANAFVFATLVDSGFVSGRMRAQAWQAIQDAGASSFAPEEFIRWMTAQWVIHGWCDEYAQHLLSVCEERGLDPESFVWLTPEERQEAARRRDVAVDHWSVSDEVFLERLRNERERRTRGL